MTTAEWLITKIYLNYSYLSKERYIYIGISTVIFVNKSCHINSYLILLIILENYVFIKFIQES